MAIFSVNGRGPVLIHATLRLLAMHTGLSHNWNHTQHMKMNIFLHNLSFFSLYYQLLHPSMSTCYESQFPNLVWSICDHAVTATCCHMVYVFMVWEQYVVTWYMCSCCDSNMSHGTSVHAVTATCHMVHVFMLWQQHVTQYTCSCCDSNMSHGTRVHAVTCCHMVHVFMLWQQYVVTWYTCSCCNSNMLSHGTHVHAVTATCCHTVHVFTLWQQHVVTCPHAAKY
jgi:hypothetical protein